MAAPALYRPALGEPPAGPPLLTLGDLDLRGGLLLRSTNWLGDALMSLPAAWQLKRLLPPGRALAILCPDKLSALWEAVPWVDRVIGFSGRGLSLAGRPLALTKGRLGAADLAAVRAFDPGAGIVFPNSFGAAWDLAWARVPNRIGRTGRGRLLLLDWRLPAWRRVPGQDRCHQARHYLEIAAACGPIQWRADYPTLEPRLTGERLQTLRALLGQKPGEILVLAPGAAYGPAKQWPVANFARVAQWWAERHGLVVTVGEPREKAAAATVIADCRRGLNLAGKTNLTELCWLLRQARACVANDSGAMHLAAALGVPGVALFGSTDPVSTGPLGASWIVARQAPPCSPCLKRRCPREDRPYECLTGIAAGAVIHSLQELRERTAP